MKQDVTFVHFTGIESFGVVQLDVTFKTIKLLSIL